MSSCIIILMAKFSVEEWSNVWNSIKYKDDYEKVVEAYVKSFTEVGDIVLDPFAAKGETLVACHNCNRNGIGLDSSAKNIEVMREKLKKLEGQLKLDFSGAKEKCKQLIMQGGVAEIESVWKEYYLPVVDLVVTKLRKEVLKDAAAMLEKVGLKLKLQGVMIVMIPLELEREGFITEVGKKGFVVDSDIMLYSTQAVWMVVRREF